MRSEAEPAGHDWTAQQGRMERLSTYYGWITAKMAPHFRPGRVLDAGCGSGLLLEAIAPRFREAVGIDGSAENCERASERLAGLGHVRIRQVDLDREDLGGLEPESFDTIVSSDLMEHLEDDASFVRKMKRLLVPGGRLVIKVPAHPLLYGSIDEASGHHRRYTRDGLRSLLRGAGLSVRDVGYMNMAGAALYFVRSRIQRRKTEFSATLRSEGLGRVNAWIPLLARIESRVRPPFGLSVVGAAEKPT